MCVEGGSVDNIVVEGKTDKLRPHCPEAGAGKEEGKVGEAM